MESEENIGRKNFRQGLLREVFRSFVSSTFDLVEELVENFIREQQRKIFNQLSKVIVLFTGCLFLINALALFISDYIGKAAWVGYGIVGGGTHSFVTNFLERLAEKPVIYNLSILTII